MRCWFLVDDQRAVGDLFFQECKSLGDYVELIDDRKQGLLVLDGKDLGLIVQLDRD